MTNFKIECLNCHKTFKVELPHFVTDTFIHVDVVYMGEEQGGNKFTVELEAFCPHCKFDNTYVLRDDLAR
jgi:Zn finger protein HypA/HybF involved in hydrogenase expression